MPDAKTPLTDRLVALKNALDEQGERVHRVVGEAVNTLFEGDEQHANRVIEADTEIDRVDVQIERAAVAILQDACDGPPGGLTQAQIRMILTIVKVNNELERIADLMVSAAEQAAAFRSMRSGTGISPAFRVLSNSVIGIAQFTVRSLRDMNSTQAGIVLKSDDTTEAFKRQLLRDVEARLSEGQATVDDAFAIHTVAASFARAADHCTNIAEQIIYVDTGLIVRHENDRWTDPASPDTND